MTDAPPPVSIEAARQSLFGRASVIWVIPIAALLISLGVAWQSYNDRGPLIAIEFQNGAGVAARETELRFRDINVGLVEDVKFSEGLNSVIVYVRLDKEVAPYVDAGSTFWVVRPELTAQGVTGLDTVISGVFIEGSWDNEVGPLRERFKGLETTPLFRGGNEGLEIALRTTPGGTMSDNTPILYRGIEVGRVGTASISQGGSFAIAEAIIYEPHGRLITESTRFWETSGFSVSIGPAGAEIDFSSLATLVGGGITFDTFVSGGGAITDGKVFEVYVDQQTARNSVFNASEVETLELRVVFDENISGLATGAAVELSGLKIGFVESLNGVIDRDVFGDSRVRLSVVLTVQPARLGLQGEITPEAALAFLSERVRNGLRARLASGSILTGGLKIELVEIEDDLPREITRIEGNLPTIPSTESLISDAAATVEGVLSRINNLPIEELLNSAVDLLDGAQAFVNSDDLRQTPLEVRALLSELRDVVTSEDVQKIPVTLNATLGRLEAVLGQIEEEQAVTRLLSVVDSASKAADAVGASVAGVPALVQELEAVAAKAGSLPLEELTTQLTELLGSVDAMVGTPAAQELPASLSAALNELNATLTELREGGTVKNVNATLSSAREAAESVAISSRDLPALVDQITQVFEQASATIASYNKGDVITRDAQAAMRDISKAADAIAALARLLERNPSALIRGR